MSRYSHPGMWQERSGVPATEAREMRRLAGETAQQASDEARATGGDGETVYGEVERSEQNRLFNEWAAAQRAAGRTVTRRA